MANARFVTLGVSYYRLGYWALLYVPLVVAAFYLSYFSTLFEAKALVVHIHFAVMVLWLSMIIAQPLLIKNQQHHIHRRIGMLSYVVAPLVVVTGYAMLRLGYHKFINNLSTSVTAPFTDAQILHEAAMYASIAWLYLIWFPLFYCLAIANKRNMHAHSRYMLGAALTLTGPTIDRIVFNMAGAAKIGFLPIEAVAFVIVDMILLVLIALDSQQGRPVRPLATALLVYVLGQLAYLTMPQHGLWDIPTAWLLGAPESLL